MDDEYAQFGDCLFNYEAGQRLNPYEQEVIAKIKGFEKITSEELAAMERDDLNYQRQMLESLKPKIEFETYEPCSCGRS